MNRRSWSPQWLIAGVSLWMALAGNGALWRRLNELDLLARPSGWLFALGLLVAIWSTLMLVLGLLAWRPTLKISVIALLLSTALASHFMLRYRVMMDPGMLTNVLQTDAREAGALLDSGLAVSFLLLGAVPAWLVWRHPVHHGHLRSQLLRNIALTLGAAGMLTLSLLANFRTLAPVMRNHKELRYIINPLNNLYALGHAATKPWRMDTGHRLALGEDARPRPASAAKRHPTLLVLVLGETARSDHFGINGYRRDTTPQLAQEERIVSFTDAWSCGTSTAASVPCMFSHLTRQQFNARKTESEGLLDVLQHAGLAVLWVDNQSGCKGVCDRVPHVETPSGQCPEGECLDDALLEGLDARIQALDPARRARGTVVVLHQMGSHGPAYFRRSPANRKPFQPECALIALQDCEPASIINAYDNSIVSTDHMLGVTIAWLKRQQSWADTAMMYVSDHGESLGENHLYLHGLPYGLAPDTQKKIPWVSWWSPSYGESSGLSLSCLRQRAARPISHDHYFHSVLGLMDVESSVYRAELDAYAGCRHIPLTPALP